MPLGFRVGHRVRASRRRLSPFRTSFLIVLAIVMSSMAGGLAYFIPAAQLFFESTGQVIHVTPSPSSTASASASSSPSATAAPVTGAFTVLLLGSDDDSKFIGDHVLTQSMILVRVVPSTKQVTMLSIPRDLFVHLSTGGSGKIDGAYSYGGADAAIATVEQDFGVQVDDYIWIGLLGLVKLIDAIGGVDVVTSNPVMDDYYPADIISGWPYDYERVAVLAGPQHLDGLHAMQYVRSRHGDLQSDLGRSQRQQQVLIAIRQKAKQISPEDLPQISKALGGELKTSMGLSKVAQLLPLASSFDSPDSINQIVLANPYTHGCGCPETYITANWSLILPLVHQYFP
ncbi:MAG TPA: LCP family protein [Candidatus Limnocylindrales bacterium]|nr:LCP family protein [Candidatus Limnocylindrales bacterium]